jgi:PAS domain S-box-containing protein
MVDNLHNEVLLELVFSIDNQTNEPDILNKSIPFYLRKLNCFFACVLKKNNEGYEEKLIIPAATVETEHWLLLKNKILSSKSDANQACCESIFNGNFYYKFQLDSYGILILGRKNQFAGNITHELKAVVNHLGKALNHACEHEERIKGEIKQIKLLEELKASKVEMLKAIDDYKKSETALKASETHLKSLIQTLPDMIWLKNKQGVYISCNKIFEDYLGIDESNLIGKTDYDISTKKNADNYTTEDRKVIARGNQIKIEKSLVFASNKRKAIIEIVKSPMVDSDGNIYGVLGIGHEITELKNRENELKESQEKYRMITQSTLDIIFIIDKFGKQLFFNDRVEDILGYSVDELIGKSFINFIPKSELPNYLSHLKTVFSKKEISNFVTKIYHKKGHLVDVEINGKLVKAGNDYVGQGAIRDISRRIASDNEIKLKNEQLVKLNAEKDKFFSIIAHDLRSPFNSFLGLTQIMNEELQSLNMEQIQQFASTLNTSASKLYSLLENLLQWAKAQQGLIPFKPQEIVLLQTINESLAMAVEIAKIKSIEIIYKFPVDLQIFADKNIVQTVMRNLVSNAIKFTPHKGKIYISARILKNNSVEISVKDTGIGMSSYLLDKLFQIDIQTNREGTDGEASSGLGLYLCKEFIELHGGEIWAESKEGIGSTFYFTIPMVSLSE